MPNIVLSETTKVNDILKEYPFLKEVLTELDPKLKRIQNPILSKTVARKATLTDVSQLIKRSKTDPIFDFTNAFSDKNIKKTLFLFSSLLNSNFHVLQILKALTNHIRKIFAAKCFIENVSLRKQQIWVKGQDFNRFNKLVVPEIKIADDVLTKEIGLWQETTSDFFLASKSKSTYPEYQIFKKSDNFSLTELENIILDLGKLDNKFKSSSQDEQILIKDFIFRTLN